MSDKNKVVSLEAEVRTLKGLLLRQMEFGTKMTEIVAKMDNLLTRKTLENENLAKKQNYENTYSDSHWRKTIYMQHMPNIVYTYRFC